LDPEDVAVAEFNNCDGKPDLAVTNEGSNNVLGKGDGTFHPQQTYPVGSNTAPVGLAVNGEATLAGTLILILSNSALHVSSTTATILASDTQRSHKKQVLNWKS